MVRRVSSERPILCAVLDGPALGPDPGDSARALFAAGVDWIQLRDRSLETIALLRLARSLVEARDAASPPPHPRRVLVNRRLDIVLAAGANGAHLGFDAVDAATAAALLPADALLGASLHSVDEIRSSLGSGLCYAHLAPIWDPLSKPASRPSLGLDALRQASGLGLLVLAQGGIDPDRAALAVEAGAAGVAVTGVLGRSGSPLDAVRRLREALDRK